MEDEAIAVCNSVMAANAGAGTARDVLFARTGNVVEPASLRYQKQRRQAEVASEFGRAMKGTPAPESFLQDLLNDEGISYVALFDDFMESDLLKETGKGRPRTQRRIVSRSMTADGVTEESEFLPPEQHEIQAECCTMRQSLQMGDGRILIAVAWVTSEEKRLFHLFPEVLKADVTSQTNKERRPLFLLVGKDSYGSTFTALRCFMPSEQKWMFQWLWESATPLLMGKAVLRRNNLLLTDGDFNEYEPFVNARDTLYPNSQHGLCCYHLISLAISNKLGLCLSHLSARGKAFIRTFTDWVHSWTNDVETMEEYNLSKAALDCWFKSPAVVQELQAWQITALQNYILTSILPHERKFLYCGRLRLRSFDERTTSNAEAENSSLKTGTGNTLTSKQLHAAAKTLNDKSKVRSVAHAQTYATHAMSSGTWSNTETVKIVTPYAEGRLQDCWERSSAYASVRVDVETWYVQKLPVSSVASGNQHPQFC
jgi:hypothetical protein